MAISRKLEDGGLYINRWQIGLYKQRSPLFTPMSSMGIQLVNRLDSLWDGQNIDISHNFTLVRRPGFTRYCSTAFGASDYPLSFFSFKNTSGTIKLMVDTPTKLYWFNTSSITAVITKNTTAQGSITKVGNMLYYCDGNDSDTKKWDGTTSWKWGVVAPATAPTISFSAGSLSPKSGYKYVYCYKNSTTGSLSTASPVSASTLAATNKNFTIQGASSADSQVDKVEIYRTADGGSVYYYLTTVNNGGTWSYTDSNPDSALNTFKVAPQNNLNDPPPSGISVSCFHLGRMWVAAGNKLYFGAGPDVTNGVPEECFPPANVFTLPAKITAMASTSSGLAVFTEDDAYVVIGSSTASFVPKLWQENFGVKSPNCLVQDGDMLIIFTSNRQLYQIVDGLQEIGFPIQAQLGAFNPATTYLTLHRSGADEGLFISDGSSNMYRYSLAMNCWSTVYQPVGGVGCISSLETTTATYKLLLGRPTASGYILGRDTTVFSDDGTAYPAWATVGSLVLSPPGEVAKIDAVLLEMMPNGTYPTVSVLLNEVSGSFVPLPNPVPDPPELSASPSTTLLMKRHYLKAAQTPLPQLVRHMQVKFTFATEAAANELLGLAIQ
jgi:hypothetical protein